MVVQARRRQVSPERAAAFAEATKDPQKLAALYAEFAEEDRALANTGMTTYARELADIDHAE